MSDNKTNVGTQDDVRVDKNDPSEIQFIQRKFPNKSAEEIRQAIEAAGPMRRDIEEYLGTKR
jgi:hypothetical protein